MRCLIEDRSIQGGRLIVRIEWRSPEFEAEENVLVDACVDTGLNIHRKGKYNVGLVLPLSCYELYEDRLTCSSEPVIYVTADGREGQALAYLVPE